MKDIDFFSAEHEIWLNLKLPLAEAVWIWQPMISLA